MSDFNIQKRQNETPQHALAESFLKSFLEGRSWREIVAEMGISKGSAQRAFCGLPKKV
jgi:hypothetical protein